MASSSSSAEQQYLQRLQHLRSRLLKLEQSMPADQLTTIQTYMAECHTYGIAPLTPVLYTSNIDAQQKSYGLAISLIMLETWKKTQQSALDEKPVGSPTPREILAHLQTHNSPSFATFNRLITTAESSLQSYKNQPMSAPPPAAAITIPLPATTTPRPPTAADMAANAQAALMLTFVNALLSELKQVPDPQGKINRIVAFAQHWRKQGIPPLTPFAYMKPIHPYNALIQQIMHYSGATIDEKGKDEKGHDSHYLTPRQALLVQQHPAEQSALIDNLLRMQTQASMTAPIPASTSSSAAVTAQLASASSHSLGDPASDAPTRAYLTTLKKNLADLLDVEYKKPHLDEKQIAKIVTEFANTCRVQRIPPILPILIVGPTENISSRELYLVSKYGTTSTIKDLYQEIYLGVEQVSKIILRLENDFAVKFSIATQEQSRWMPTPTTTHTTPSSLSTPVVVDYRYSGPKTSPLVDTAKTEFMAGSQSFREFESICLTQRIHPLVAFATERDEKPCRDGLKKLLDHYPDLNFLIIPDARLNGKTPIQQALAAAAQSTDTIKTFENAWITVLHRRSLADTTNKPDATIAAMEALHLKIAESFQAELKKLSPAIEANTTTSPVPRRF